MGVVLGGEEPSQLSQRRGTEPKIVAEAKIGTYRSAELGWEPAAESGQGAAGSGLGLLSLLLPTPAGGGGRIRQDPAHVGCSVPRLSRETGEPERQK